MGKRMPIEFNDSISLFMPKGDDPKTWSKSYVILAIPDHVH